MVRQQVNKNAKIHISKLRQPFERIIKTLASLAGVSIVLFGVAHFGRQWLISHYFCLTETKQEIENYHGFDFLIIETDCDVIAKDAMISVIVSATGKKQNDILFKYEPIQWTDDLPSVNVVDNNIIISVHSIARADLQKRHWNDMIISYKIDFVANPKIDFN